MKIVIGCDEAGYKMKENIKVYLQKEMQNVVDIGVYDQKPTDYPDIAHILCQKIVTGDCEKGILICGTGIGMAITANKIPGIRAAVGHDIYSVERSVLSNDCQVLCLGARILAPQYAQMLVRHWLELTFQDGRSTQKVKKIMDIEHLYLISDIGGERSAEDNK